MQQMSSTGRWTAQHVALVLAVAAALLLAIAPTGSSESVTTDSTGTVTESVSHTTLVQSQGPGVLIVLAIPVVLTLAPLLVPPRLRRTVGLVCAVLLAALVILGALTIGIWFMPALIATLVASLGRRPTEAGAIAGN